MIRPAPTGSKSVTWGEFVELRYPSVRYSARPWCPSAGPALIHRRLAEKLGVAYPLASARPWVGPGRKLLLEAQKLADLPEDLWGIVEPASGQQLLLPAADAFLKRVDFDDDKTGSVIRLYPEGKTSPIVIDPECDLVRLRCMAYPRSRSPTRSELVTLSRLSPTTLALSCGT